MDIHRNGAVLHTAHRREMIEIVSGENTGKKTTIDTQRRINEQEWSNKMWLITYTHTCIPVHCTLYTLKQFLNWTEQICKYYA